MATPSYLPFPDLSKIAFRTSDLSEHEGGGHCAGIPDGLPADRWDFILAQHQVAFDHLVNKAQTEGSWAMTRPVLFGAHHVCEVALKAAIARQTGREPKHGHFLEPLVTRLTKAGGLAHLEPAQFSELSQFVAFMHDLTPDGQSTRYPLLDEKDLGTRWCCINSAALREAVYAFMGRLYPA